MLPFVVSAADTVDFSIDSAQGQYGDTVTLTVSATGGTNIAGFLIQIKHNNSIAYVSDSVKAIKSGLNDITAYESSGSGITNVLWESVIKQNLEGKLFSVQFKICTAEEKNVPVTLEIKDLYSNHTDYAQIPSTVQGGTVTIGAPSQAVLDTITAINTIPETVTTENYTQSDALIRDAVSKYTALPDKDKVRVNNYSKLLDAIEQLREVKNVIEETEAKSLADKFKTDHAAVLVLKAADVTLNDESKITAALTAYTSMNNPSAQALLVKEKNYLNNLKAQIDVLKQAQADKIAREEAIKQELAKAEETIKEFHSDSTYEWLFTGKVNLEEITIDNYQVYFEAAQLAKNTYSFYSPIIQGEMQKEINFIESIFDRIEEVIAQSELDNAPEMVAYYSFLRNFSALISLDKENVTADDYIDLTVAVSVYSTLYPKTQGMLDKEYKHLSELLEVAEEFYNTQTDDSDSADQNMTDTNEDDASTGDLGASSDSESQGSDGEKTQTVVQSFIGEMSPLIFWLLMVTAIMVLLMFAAMGVWVYMNKKYPMIKSEEEIIDAI